MKSVLLLSGGMDSAALTYLVTPAVCLFVDYGQGAATAERRAAQAIAREAGVSLAELALDLRAIGPETIALGRADIPREWWPYRNQLLASFGAATAIARGCTQVCLGTVATDGDRHVDGRRDFIEQLSNIIEVQEGGIRIAAPAIGMTTEELIVASKIPRQVLALSYSCHIGDQPCGAYGGCEKRESVWANLSTTGQG